MRIGTDKKKNFEKLFDDHSLLREREDLREILTKTFINDISGVMQCIQGNAELLKIKYVHKLNPEVALYLHKIEENGANLVELVNAFQKAVRSDRKHFDNMFFTTPTTPDKTIHKIR